jgi:hypothetical protein
MNHEICKRMIDVSVTLDNVLAPMQTEVTVVSVPSFRHPRDCPFLEERVFLALNLSPNTQLHLDVTEAYTPQPC